MSKANSPTSYFQCLPQVALLKRRSGITCVPFFGMGNLTQTATCYSDFNVIMYIVWQYKEDRPFLWICWATRPCSPER